VNPFSWIINAMLASMIFFPDKAFYQTPEEYGFDWEDVYLQTSDEVKIHGWYLTAPNQKGAIIFYHGNAGNISYRLFKSKGWIDRGISVFLVDYRGFGKSEGKIKGAQDLLRDGQAALDWTVQTKDLPLSKIILYGESIGSFPALKLGSDNKVGAVILEAAATSLHDLARLHYPFVPKVILNDFAMPNDEQIKDLKAPLFILHGTRDEICPYKMGQALYELAPEPKEMFSIEGGMHNDLPMVGGEDFIEKPYRFVSRYL